MVAALLSAGHVVEVWDRLPAGPRAREHLAYREVDLALPVSPPEEPFDAVFHLAAHTENRSGDASLVLQHLDSVAYLANVVNALRSAPPRVMVYASSQLVYGMGTADEKVEVVRPASIFGAGKLAGEHFLRILSEEIGFLSVACRLSNVVGPSMRRGVIPDLVREAYTAVDGRLHVLGDGSQQRTFIDAADCADALLRVALSPNWDVVNVGNSTTASIRDIAQAVAALPDPALAVAFGTSDRGWATDPGTVIPRVDRLASLGWKPRLTAAQAVEKAVSALWAEQARSCMK
jgi:UDP-glucose 4-epimerase